MDLETINERITMLQQKSMDKLNSTKVKPEEVIAPQHKSSELDDMKKQIEQIKQQTELQKQINELKQLQQDVMPQAPRNNKGGQQLMYGGSIITIFGVILMMIFNQFLLGVTFGGVGAIMIGLYIVFFKPELADKMNLRKVQQQTK